MTTNAIPPLIEYIENGSSTVHNVPFRFIEAEHLVVQRIVAGVVTTLTLGVDYTVSGADDPDGGSITKSDGGTNGATLRIRRETPRVQGMDYSPTGTFPAESHEAALDRLSLIEQELDVEADLLAARVLRFPNGVTVNELPADMRGKFLAFDAENQPIGSTGGPGDGGLRTDLAQDDGAALVGTPQGSLLSVLFGQSALSHMRGPKEFARNWAEAVEMCDDHSEMRGFAAYAGTTGGAGEDIFKVWNSSDVEGKQGSFRWAVAQAIANGGGRIIFVPVGWFDVNIRSLVNVTGDNITIDAPGRNVRFTALNDVEMVRLSGQNIILRRIVFSRLPGLTVIDGDNIYERDAIQIIPVTADKIWIDQCTITESSDGGLDAAGSNLDVGADPCRITVSRCLQRRSDKGMLWGSTRTSLDPAPSWAANALDEDPVLFVTCDRCVFDGVGQRSPRLNALVFCHKINNVHVISRYRPDDGEEREVYGSFASTGGKLLSEGDYLLMGSPEDDDVLGMYAQTTAWDDSLNTGPGALKSVGSVADTGVLIQEANTSYVPDPPYSITPEAVPGTVDERWNWLLTRFAQAGAEVAPLSEMNYVFVDQETADAANLYADGYHVVKVKGGYRVRTRDDIPASNEGLFALAPVSLTFQRGTTKDIASGAFNLPTNGLYFAVDTEGEAATDDLLTINAADGGTPAADTVIIIRAASSSRDVVVKKSGGNIAMPSDVLLDVNSKLLALIYDDGAGKWLPLFRPSIGNDLVREYATTTVAALGTATDGRRAIVTDSNVAASGNFGAVVAGGGSNTVPVVACDGAWLIG